MALPLTAAAREHLRRALSHIEDELYGYVQEQMNAVHEGIDPGKTTLDQITFLKGKAMGADELWHELEKWAQEPETP